MKILLSILLHVSSNFFVAAAATNYLRHKNNRLLIPSFPLYNQQCRDDAGPSFLDDEEGKKYFSGRPAFAVDDGGDCPDPLKWACATKPKLDAFLEGPVDCGDSGWFCRIVEQPGWPTNNLNSDLNFGSCNTTGGLNDEGFDRDGHCHGSDSDDTFYWWVRDHWFRGYNGRLRCCCGWDDVIKGGIVNSCDYRRLVTPSENLEDCRDANEEGVSPYRAGCKANVAPALNQPLVEDDKKCWEVQNFGEPSDDVEDINNNNNSNDVGDNDNDNEEDNNSKDEENEENDINEEEKLSPPTAAPTPTSTCPKNSKEWIFKNGRGKKKKCSWIKTSKSIEQAITRCGKLYNGVRVRHACPRACAVNAGVGPCRFILPMNKE